MNALNARFKRDTKQGAVGRAAQQRRSRERSQERSEKRRAAELVARHRPAPRTVGAGQELMDLRSWIAD